MWDILGRIACALMAAAGIFGCLAFTAELRKPPSEQLQNAKRKLAERIARKESYETVVLILMVVYLLALIRAVN